MSQIISNAHFAVPIKASNNKIFDAANLLDATVSSTMGPGGRLVVIDNNGIPHVTKDGVTASEAVHSEDPVIEMNLKLLKEAARKTNKVVGDGTTSTTALACALIKQTFLKKDINIRDVFDGFEKAEDMAQSFIESKVKNVENDPKTLTAIAKISSNGDNTITELVEKAIEMAGVHGVINVEESEGGESFVDAADGAHIETNVIVKPSMERSMKTGKVAFILIEGKLLQQPAMGPILHYAQALKKKGITLVIMAEEFGKGVVSLVETNNTRDTFNVVLAETEAFGSYRRELLEDLSLLLGTTIISTNGHYTTNLADLASNDFHSIAGSCISADITNKDIILNIDSEVYHSDSVSRRFESIINKKKDLEKSGAFDNVSEDIDVRQITRRMAKFASVVTVYVGGITKGSLKERKDRVDDAVCAVASAMNNGVLPGGGSIWVSLFKALSSHIENKEVKEKSDVGLALFAQACLDVFARIHTNAGLNVDADVIKEFNDIMTKDVITGKMVEAYEYGIVDPAAVSLEAIFNSVAVAKTLLNTSAFITDGQ